MMGATIPIPQSSKAAFKGYKNDDAFLPNPGLIFDRFAPDCRGRATDKRDHLMELLKFSKKVDVELLKAWNLRWQATVRAVGAEAFEMQTDWRFVTGLGGGGPLEIGFTFHRYGFPILPGSSVKGIARAWALREIAQALGQEDLGDIDKVLSIDDEKEFENGFGERFGKDNTQASNLGSEFRRVFGTTGAAGCAVFFDAIPASLPSLELDIMNPHFPKYYQGKEPPTDSQNPVPVYFLTVAPGTVFRFAVGWRSALDDKTRALREQAEKWLKEGLLWLGAGAKTSAGYGYFIERTVAQNNSKGAHPASTQTSPAQPTESALAKRIRTLPQSQVKGSIGNLVTQWQQLSDGPEKVEVAKALLERMKQSGILEDKKWRDKEWVREVQEYCQAHAESKEENQE